MGLFEEVNAVLREKIATMTPKFSKTPTFFSNFHFSNEISVNFSTFSWNRTLNLQQQLKEFSSSLFERINAGFRESSHENCRSVQNFSVYIASCSLRFLLSYTVKNQQRRNNQVRVLLDRKITLFRIRNTSKRRR